MWRTQEHHWIHLYCSHISCFVNNWNVFIQFTSNVLNPFAMCAHKVHPYLVWLAQLRTTAFNRRMQRERCTHFHRRSNSLLFLFFFTLFNQVDCCSLYKLNENCASFFFVFVRRQSWFFFLSLIASIYYLEVTERWLAATTSERWKWNNYISYCAIISCFALETTFY